MGISPTVLAIGALATSAIGAGVGAYGQVQASNAASASAKANAQIAENNQQIATNNANAAVQAGNQQAAMSQAKTRASVGAIKASQAAAGIDVNSGTDVDVRSSAADLGELDAINIRGNAAKTAYGYQAQGTSFENTANLDTAQAANATTAGAIGAGSTLIGGLGSAGSNWSKFQTQAGSGMVAPANDSWEDNGMTA